MRGMPGRAELSDIVKQRQNEQPHDIHKVPVEGDIVQSDMVGRGEAAGKELAEEAPDDEEDADDDMETVEAGDHKKAGSINSAGVEPQAFVVEMPPFVALHADEQGAKSYGDEEPTQTGFTLLNGHFRHVECATARDQENGIDRGKENREVGDVLARRPRVACLPREAVLCPAENEIAAEKSSEEHALGYQEHDHAELGRGWRCAVVLVGIVCKGC